MTKIVKKPSEILKQANNDRKLIRQIIRDLRKARIANLDIEFHSRHDRFMAEIDCLECGNCCRSLGPLLRERDIQRLSKLLRMKTGDFCSTYLKRDEEGDMIYKEMPCPFLGDDNKCFVYGDHPGACQDFPHTDKRNMKGYLKETGKNALICPVVYLCLMDMRETLL